MDFAKASAISIAKDQVAITVGRGLFGSHLGVAFNSASEGCKVLHLRFHKDLQTDSFPTDDYCWICCVVDLPSRASAQLVGMLRGLAKKRPNIGYGINLIAGKGAFGSTGSYKAPKGSDGFTCSTMVAELFRQAGLPLIDEGSWQPEELNLAWGRAVCCLLETLHPAESDHIAAVKRNNVGLRVRPEEVAAAAAMPYTARPVSFSTAKTKAPTVFSCLEAACFPTAVPAHLAHCVAIYEVTHQSYCACGNRDQHPE